MHSTRLFMFFLQVKKRRKFKNQKLAKKDKNCQFWHLKIYIQISAPSISIPKFFYNLKQEGHTTITRGVLNHKNHFLWSKVSHRNVKICLIRIRNSALDNYFLKLQVHRYDHILIDSGLIKVNYGQGLA